MSKRAYRKQCIQCDKWYSTTANCEDSMFCSNECVAEYKILIDKISIPMPMPKMKSSVDKLLESCEKSKKEVKQIFDQPFTPEDAHERHMLLHDMVDVFVGENGFVVIKYFPHMNEDVRLAYGVAARIEEQIL